MSAAPTWVCRRGRRYAYRKLCDFGRALQDYERALAVGGLSAVQLHTNRAYCLAKLGRFAEALESYDLVLRANPANVHALHNRCARCEHACWRSCCVGLTAVLLAIPASLGLGGLQALKLNSAQVPAHDSSACALRSHTARTSRSGAAPADSARAVPRTAAFRTTSWAGGARPWRISPRCSGCRPTPGSAPTRTSTAAAPGTA